MHYFYIYFITFFADEFFEFFGNFYYTIAFKKFPAISVPELVLSKRRNSIFILFL